MALTEKQKKAAFVTAFVRAKAGKPNPFKVSVAEGIPADATARSIIRAGRILTLIDAAKAAGADLSALKAAIASGDMGTAIRAIDDVLLAMKPKPPRVTGLKDESAAIKVMAEAIEALQGKYDALQTRMLNAEAEIAYEATIKRMAHPRRTRTLESFRKAADAARARLAAMPDVSSNR